MSLNNLMRALELISVAPAYMRGLVEKQIYLSKAPGNLSGFSSHPAEYLRDNIIEIERNYLDSTASLFSGDKITPGGFYTGTWCRDASYILNELMEMGRRELVGSWLEWIWDHSISDSINVVHGRGSPELKYKSRAADSEFRTTFLGLLPSSVQHGYVEVYGKNPDIDSTALMIVVACRFCSEATGTSLCDNLVRRIDRAISSLRKRDVDGDHLLEQGPNEDWMDTMLRSGRVVYSQAAWGRALLEWSKLLHKVGRLADSEQAILDSRELINAVNGKLWNDDAKSFSDSPDGYDAFRLDSDRVYATSPSDENDQHQGNQRTWLTQDASLFLLLVDSFNSVGSQHIDGALDSLQEKARSYLNTLKTRAWKGLGVACVDPPSAVTGPFKWGPNMYQNGGFWPWIASIEILARMRYEESGENVGELLIKSLRYSLLEWINPVGIGSGAYPFRTSIAAVRTTLRHFSKHMITR